MVFTISFVFIAISALISMVSYKLKKIIIRIMKSCKQICHNCICFDCKSFYSLENMFEILDLFCNMLYQNFATNINKTKKWLTPKCTKYISIYRTT